MSNGNGVPVCDAACQKILLDGDSLMKEAAALCERLEKYAERNGSYSDPAPLIRAIIKAEKAVYAAQAAFLDAVGYDGERPSWLS